MSRFSNVIVIGKKRAGKCGELHLNKSNRGACGDADIQKRSAHLTWVLRSDPIQKRIQNTIYGSFIKGKPGNVTVFTVSRQTRPSLRKEVIFSRDHSAGKRNGVNGKEKIPLGSFSAGGGEEASANSIFRRPPKRTPIRCSRNEMHGNPGGFKRFPPKPPRSLDSASLIAFFVNR